MYHYKAYGLGLCSELQFPEFETAEQTPDVIISLGKVERSTNPATHGDMYFRGETPNVGAFLVRDGREIVVEPVPDVDEALLRTIILGPIIAVLLRQRGLLVLHASSIVAHGAAVAFLGGPSYGKSTLVEAFYSRGYGMVTDDVMAVQIESAYPCVVPAHPQVKLWPDAALSLGYALETLPLLFAQATKRVHYAILGFPQTPLRLQRVYVLATASRNAIDRLHPHAAFVELLRNSRATGLLRSSKFAISHFRQCAKLVEDVPIYRLQRKASLAELSDLVRFVEADLAWVS